MYEGFSTGLVHSRHSRQRWKLWKPGDLAEFLTHLAAAHPRSTEGTEPGLWPATGSVVFLLLLALRPQMAELGPQPEATPSKPTQHLRAAPPRSTWPEEAGARCPVVTPSSQGLGKADLVLPISQMGRVNEALATCVNGLSGPGGGAAPRETPGVLRPLTRGQSVLSTQASSQPKAPVSPPLRYVGRMVPLNR